MSTIVTSIRRIQSTTQTSSRRESSTSIPTTSREDEPESTTLQRQFSFLNFESATPTPSVTEPTNDTPSPTSQTLVPSATCISDNDCAADHTCSRGTCTSLVEAAPFGPAGGLGQEPTSKLSTGGAVGVVLGVIGSFLLLMGLGLWYWKRKGRKPRNVSVETPTTNRNRSASNATDQKTLVASLPNSPQNARFRVQQQVNPAFFAKLAETSNALRQNPPGAEYAHERHDSSADSGHRQSQSNEKALPLPPTDMPLPPAPTEEQRYAVNVNINKSMIFEDLSFNSGKSTPARNSEQSRMPKYRFEEYLPPIDPTPRISLTKPTRRSSDYEMEPYPRKLSASRAPDSDSDSSRSDTDDDDDETELRRKNTLKELERPPQLPPPAMPPPSPSFSLSSYFESYDWYQDIIGTEQAAHEDRVSRISTRSPARTPTKETFGAALSSNPWPPPLSPTQPSSAHLHPSTATPTTPSSFRLSPTVYQSPAKPRKTRESLRKSAMTQKSRASRSWLPDDGLYLPEEGTHDSYMMFQRRVGHGDRVESYSPL